MSNRVTVITVTTAIYVPTDKWEEHQADVLDGPHPADPSVGIMFPVPATTSADVELEDLRTTITDAIAEKMSSDLGPAVVVGYPQVAQVDRSGVAVYSDECSF